MRRPITLALLTSGLILGGCHGEPRQITPTTLGTDLTRMPRGKMTPFPWPGQSIVKTSPTGKPDQAKVDPNAATASGESVGR
jgi:hypothetical protein